MSLSTHKPVHSSSPGFPGASHKVEGKNRKIEASASPARPLVYFRLHHTIGRKYGLRYISRVHLDLFEANPQIFSVSMAPPVNPVIYSSPLNYVTTMSLHLRVSEFPELLWLRHSPDNRATVQGQAEGPGTASALCVSPVLSVKPLSLVEL